MSNAEKRFVSPLYDTTFKYLWKVDNCRRWLIKLIKLLADENLDEYTLYDPELNSGNDLKDYRLDILFSKDVSNMNNSDLINIEMYKDYGKNNNYKSYAYVFRLLGFSYEKGDKYIRKKAIQVNFYNYFNSFNKSIGTNKYTLFDKNHNMELDDITIYDVYLPVFKGLCYNETKEMYAMFSFLGAENYDEMKKIASGNKEALRVMEELENLSVYEKFIGVYDNEAVQRKLQNGARDEGFEDGFEKGKIEAAKNFLKNGVDIKVVSDSTGLSIEELKKLV